MNSDESMNNGGRMSGDEIMNDGRRMNNSRGLSDGDISNREHENSCTYNYSWQKEKSQHFQSHNLISPKVKEDA